jgi:hypothetical protein
MQQKKRKSHNGPKEPKDAKLKLSKYPEYSFYMPIPEPTLSLHPVLDSNKELFRLLKWLEMLVLLNTKVYDFFEEEGNRDGFVFPQLFTKESTKSFENLVDAVKALRLQIAHADAIKDMSFSEKKEYFLSVIHAQYLTSEESTSEGSTSEGSTSEESSSEESTSEKSTSEGSTPTLSE